MAIRRLTLVLAILGVVLLVASRPSAPTPAQAADNLWVNFSGYGNAGGGFWWDPISGQVWTQELGWHSFASAVPVSPTPLWVNDLTYGSAGGGFYLDPLANQVWTAERGWELYNPLDPLLNGVLALLRALLAAAADPGGTLRSAVASGQLAALTTGSKSFCSSTHALYSDLDTQSGSATALWVLWPGSITKMVFGIPRAPSGSARWSYATEILTREGVLTSTPGGITVTKYSMRWDGLPFSDRLAVFSFTESDCDPKIAPRHPTPPAPPTSVNATPKGPTSILVEWTAAGTPDNFRVVQTSPTHRNVATVGGSTRSYSVVGLAPSTQYCFTVIAHSTGGDAHAPTFDCATTASPPVTAPTAPVNLRISAPSPTEILVEWEAGSSNASGFRVEDGPSIQKLGPSARSYRYTGLAPGTYKCVSVIAFNAAGEAGSNAGCVTTPPAGHQEVRLGGLDLNAYCQSKGVASDSMSKPRLGPGNAYGNWYCGTNLIDFNDACRWQYGSTMWTSVVGRPDDPDDAFTWQCWGTPTPSFQEVRLGGLNNLTGYCQSRGYSNYTLTKSRLGPGHAFGNWHCGTNLIDFDDACLWHYPNTTWPIVLGRPDDPNDAFTWQCWGATTWPGPW